MPQPRIQQDPVEGPRGRTSADEAAGGQIAAEPAEGDRETVEHELARAREPKTADDSAPE